MKICIFGFEKSEVVPTEVNSPWLSFIEELKKAGHEIIDKNEIDSQTVCIFNKYIKAQDKLCRKARIPNNLKIMILWEPPANSNKTYRAIQKNLFGKIFTPSKEWYFSNKSEVFLWPQILGVFKNSINHRIEKFVFIGSNKFSFGDKELYTLRRQVLSLDNGRLIDLYGLGWQKNKIYLTKNLLKSILNTPISKISLFKIFNLYRYKVNSGKGLCSSKFETATGYKYALVIENSNDYISEKLFDAVASGCITFYVGPNLAKMGYSEDLAIQLEENAQGIIETMHRFIHEAKRKQTEAILKKQNVAFMTINKRNNNIQVFQDLANSVNKYIKEL
jgi:hypothetical protein